ncbi:MAG: type II toxin-antitoxin system HicA family toxin [Solirubrobacteraceae bacterium]
MKRRDLERHARAQGAHPFDEGGNHTRWMGPNGEQSAIPRHREIGYKLARTICKQLGIAPPAGSR